MLLRRLLAVSLFCFAPALARAEEVRVIGDSIGEGLHLASGIPSPANRFNVAIYTRKALEQMRAAPKGAIVIMSLGTNDAVGGLVDQKAKVDEIVAEADKLGVKLFWVGPPCVRTAWEAHSKALDEALEAGLHAGDGVHFTMAGYRMLWQKAATVAGVPVVVASSATPTASASHHNGHGAHHGHGHKRRHHAPEKSPDAM